MQRATDLTIITINTVSTQDTDHYDNSRSCQKVTPQFSLHSTHFVLPRVYDACN